MNNWGDFCTFCGTAMQGEFPRKCDNGHFTYQSPVTVGIALQPVKADGRTGILVVQRNINPFKGGFALPGGFVDHGELSKPAAVRELFEETTLHQDAKDAVYFTEEKGLSYFDNDPRQHTMYFYAMPLLESSAIDLEFKNSETKDLAVMFLAADGKMLENDQGTQLTLCFPSHHNAAVEFLKTYS